MSAGQVVGFALLATLTAGIYVAHKLPQWLDHLDTLVADALNDVEDNS